MRKKMTYVEAIDVAIASVQNEAAVERLQTLRDTLVKVGEKQRSSSAQRLAKKRDENTQIIEKAFAMMEAGVAYFTIDIDTGEVLAECKPEVDDYHDWDNCDDDCGFDPYLGCYTDDC